MIGDVLWIWMTEDKPGEWCQIAAMIPGGASGALSHRRRDVAENLFGPLAREHGKKLSQAVELRCYESVKVVERAQVDGSRWTE